MKVLQSVEKGRRSSPREDHVDRSRGPLRVGPFFRSLRPKGLSAASLLGFAIWLQFYAGAAATESLTELCRRLQHPRDVAERLHAAEAIAEYGQRAVPTLCELLRHRDPKVREFAGVALVRMGPDAEQAVPQLIAILQIQQEPTRAIAAFALGRIGPAATSAVPALLRVAHDPDWGLRKDAINALASIRTADAVQALTSLLQSDERELQVAALTAIQQCGPSAAIALTQILDFAASVPDSGLSDEAFLTAGHLGAAAADDLTALLDADQAETRRRAAMALSRMGSPGASAVPALQRVLHDPDATVRFWAARALGEIGLTDSASLFALVQVLTDPDADVRWAAAEALRRNGVDVTSAMSGASH